MKKFIIIFWGLSLLLLNFACAQSFETMPQNNIIDLNQYVRQETSADRFKTQKELPLNNTAKAINDSFVNNVSNFVLMQYETIYKEVSTPINAINPTKMTSSNSYYPGLRGPNELVIYTPEFGLRTGTNEYGTEAIVVDNVVVRMNGADSIIPQGGYVISGHGKAKKWITENIQIGSKIEIDSENRVLVSRLTPDSLIFAAKERVKEVNELLEYYRNQDILYSDKVANDFLSKAKDQLKKAERDREKTQQCVHNAMNYLNDAIKNALPYRQNEFKGIWLRPTEITESDIIRTIERIKLAGIENIFIETYFHGMTIYPSGVLESYNVISQRPEFVGFDPLEVWIKEAHDKGLKVHIWFETFYLGRNNGENTIVKTYPQWTNKRKSTYDSLEPVVSLSENNGYFLDPANPEARELLLKLIDEIIYKYRPDGINLDYIRYPQTVEAKFSGYESSNWGYTETAREEFKNYNNVDPIDISYGTYEWSLWSAYRQNKIFSFVNSVHEKTKANKILLSAVVFPDLSKASETKMQNWKYWVSNGIVEAITPLILTSDKNTAELMLKNLRIMTPRNIALYPGLFVTFMGGSVDDLLIQIQKIRETSANGLILFDYAHLNHKYIDALNTRVCNKQSLEQPKGSVSKRDFSVKSGKSEKKLKRKKKKDNC